MSVIGAIYSHKKLKQSDFFLFEKSHKYKNLKSSNTKISSQSNFCLINNSVKDVSNIYCNTREKIMVNFEGDITNKPELCILLKLSSNSPSSVIVFKAYLKWGEKLAYYIYGFFSCIIIDENIEKLIIFNDHLGSKPLYYSKINQDFFVSSDIKGILPFLDNLAPNKNRIRDYFIFFNGKDGETFFEKIYRLPPASSLVFFKNSIKISNYFNFNPNIEYTPKSNMDCYEEFREIFFNVIGSLEKSNLYVGSCLSGGVDSSSITSSLAYLGMNVSPQNVVFKGLNSSDTKLVDERYYVDSVIKKHRLKNNEINIENIGCLTNIKKNIDFYDEPPSLINGYVHESIFNNLNSENITTLFDGFDGDTTISHGYEHLFELGRKFKICSLLDEYKLVHQNFSNAKVNFMTPIKNYVIKSYIPDRILWLLYKERMVPNEWHKKVKNNFFDRPSFNEVIKNYGLLPLPNIYKKNSRYCHYLDINNKTIVMSLNLINQNANRYGVDIKFPFMDRKLMEFCLSLPSSEKLNKGKDRFVLRQAMKNIIPTEVYERKTKSDLSPFSRNQLEELSDKIIISHAEEIGFIDIDYLVKETLKNKSKNMFEIYQIIIFSMWLKKYQFKF